MWLTTKLVTARMGNGTKSKSLVWWWAKNERSRCLLEVKASLCGVKCSQAYSGNRNENCSTNRLPMEAALRPTAPSSKGSGRESARLISRIMRDKTAAHTVLSLTS